MLVSSNRGRPRRAAAVTLAGASLAAAATLGSLFLGTALDAWSATAASGPADPADGILLVVGLAGTFLSLWLGLGMTLSALSALPGALGQLSDRLADQVAPQVVRKVVALVLGTTLTAAFVPGTAISGIGHGPVRPDVVAESNHKASGFAEAAPGALIRLVSEPSDRTASTLAAPLPDWKPDPPASHWKPDPPASTDRSRSPKLPQPPVRPSRETDGVVVHRGDTLWSITARQLGPEATTADISEQWPRWHAANRKVIGDDPNVILPGQLLIPPASPRAGGKSATTSPRSRS